MITPPQSANLDERVALVIGDTASVRGSAGLAALAGAKHALRVLVQSIAQGQVDRVRYAAPERALLEVLQAGNAANGRVVSMPVSAEGRLELRWHVREQSISTDYQRYGNLGIRADEVRAGVP